MKSRCSMIALALAAGGMLPAASMAQKSAPGHVKALRAHPARQLGPVAQRLEPSQMAGIRRLPNGRYELTTPWMPYISGGSDVPSTPIFDCFEADPAGLPTGFCAGGCSANQGCPTSPAGSRWFFGAAYNNPFATNDMATIAPGFNNALATRVEFEFAWRYQNAVGAGNCYVAVFTSETFNSCASGPPATAGDYDGVIFTFNALAPGVYYSDADLTAAGLSFQMPSDGSGAYQIVIANAYDQGTGALTIDANVGTQPMLWSTGEHETPPDGRAGTETVTEWDDDFPVDGQYTVAECYDNSQPTICPNLLSAMVLFYGEGAPPATCYPNCDHSTTVPFLNVLDFNCFLNAFSSGLTYANCDNSTTPPVLNVLDFNCFLNSFSTGCSAP